MITTEDIKFKDSKFLFSKIRRDLSSYDAANLIDEGEFPQYVMDVMKTLGISVFKQDEAIIKIKDYKGKLPQNFSVLHAAYKCTPYISKKDRIHEQGDPIHWYQDVTWEILKKDSDCEFSCVQQNEILEHIEIRQFFKTEATDARLIHPVLLRLTPNVKKEYCSSDCPNLSSKSQYEITISDGELFTNFSDDAIYLKYYGIPFDEDGVPLIPDIEYVEKTIEWYIKYQILMSLWMNGSVPNIENRWQYAELQYEKFKGMAKHERKFPSFAHTVNRIRRQRSSHPALFFAQQDRSGNWQVN